MHEISDRIQNLVMKDGRSQGIGKRTGSVSEEGSE